MNFKDKYLKYKKKYLKHKNEQKGGFDDYSEENNDIFILNGPSSIYYFPDIKGKKIMLLGDYHVTDNNCFKQLKYLKNYKYQTDTIRFINYLAKKNSEKGTCLDFMSEEPYYGKDFSTFHIKELSENLKNADKNYFDQNNTTAIGNPKFFNQIMITNYYFMKSDCGPIKRDRIETKKVYPILLKKMKIKNKCYKGFRYHYWDIMDLVTSEFDKFDDGTMIGKKNHALIIIFMSRKLFNEYFESLNLTDSNDIFKYILSIYTYTCGFKDRTGAYKMGKKNFKNIYEYITDENVIENNNVYFEHRKEYKKGDMKKIILSIKETEDLAKRIYKQVKNADKKYINTNDIYNYWVHRFKKGAFSNNWFVEIESKTELSNNILNIFRSSMTETYTISRMFRKFKNKRKIPNCEEKKSMKNIIHLAGNTHTLNIVDFIKWKFNIKPEISLSVDFGKEGFEQHVQQCLFVRKFNPFGFKMPWN